MFRVRISSNMNNAKLYPPGYHHDVLRKERTYTCGGVFLAFKDAYVVSQVESNDTNCKVIWTEVAFHVHLLMNLQTTRIKSRTISRTE